MLGSVSATGLSFRIAPSSHSPRATAYPGGKARKERLAFMRRSRSSRIFLFEGFLAAEIGKQ
jgi:hypothetical protein